MPKKILIPIPSQDFDPTETAIPWKIFTRAGIEVRFATPDGLPANADPKMVTGEGLGPLAPLLRATREAREAYEELSHSTDFLRPLSWSEIDATQFDALMLPGGHARGMKPYLESRQLQDKVALFFQAKKPVGAICHGVVLAARARSQGKSVLHGRQATALPKWMELSAWLMTAIYMGSYYRTYPTTVEDEVRHALGKSGKFRRGPLMSRRDRADRPGMGFVVLDDSQEGRLLTARWPGDAHRFAAELLKLIG
jgi:protease I